MVIIYGSDLGTIQGTGWVLVGGRVVPALAWSPVAVAIYVDLLAYSQAPVALDAAYPVQVVRADSKKSNLLNLTVTSAPPAVYNPGVVDQQTRSDQPTVTGFQKATFCQGNDLVIYGSGFGDSQGGGYITLTVPFLDSTNKKFTQVFAIPVLAWSENAINAVLSLPSGAQLGSYGVTVHRGNGKTASGTIVVTACM